MEVQAAPLILSEISINVSAIRSWWQQQQLQDERHPPMPIRRPRIRLNSSIQDVSSLWDRKCMNTLPRMTLTCLRPATHPNLRPMRHHACPDACRVSLDAFGCQVRLKKVDRRDSRRDGDHGLRHYLPRPSSHAAISCGPQVCLVPCRSCDMQRPRRGTWTVHCQAAGLVLYQIIRIQ